MVSAVFKNSRRLKNKNFLRNSMLFSIMFSILFILLFLESAHSENSDICIRREVIFNEKNKNANTVLVKLNARTNKTIEFYEVIPKECAVGEHGTMSASKNTLKATISNDSEMKYELMCNYGNHTIQGYYFVEGNYKQKFYIENTTFFIQKVIPKELPIWLWFVLLMLLIIFFIAVLKREEL
ncbi:MAG: hypothetical protein ACP5OZ_03580 [Candidatus Woesearchaeota archaeon]